jgi:hypothetical protein
MFIKFSLSQNFSDLLVFYRKLFQSTWITTPWGTTCITKMIPTCTAYIITSIHLLYVYTTLTTLSRLLHVYLKFNDVIIVTSSLEHSPT